MSGDMHTKAADDLRRYMKDDGWDYGLTLLDEALEDERRATVERIREAVESLEGDIIRHRLENILEDEEAK